MTFIQDDEAVVETWRVCLRNHTQYSRDDFCFRRRKLTKSTNSTKRKGSISPSSQLAGCCCIDIISSLSVHLLNKRKKRKKEDEECAVRRVADPLNEEGREREMSVFFESFVETARGQVSHYLRHTCLLN